LNAKSLVIRPHSRDFQANRLERNSRLADLPALRVSPARSHAEFNPASTVFCEHEVIFLLQRSLMMK